MDNVLNICSKCASKPTVCFDSTFDEYYIACSGEHCAKKAGYYKKEKVAVEDWNRKNPFCEKQIAKETEEFQIKLDKADSIFSKIVDNEGMIDVRDIVEVLPKFSQHMALASEYFKKAVEVRERYVKSEK